MVDLVGRLAILSDAGHPEAFAAGDVLLHEGGGGGHCFALTTGEVLVTTSSSAGATVVLGRRGRGDVVGELSILDEQPRSARVVARTDVSARRFTASEFEGLLLRHPEFALAELRRLAAEVRSLSRRITGRSDELRTRVVDLVRLQAEITGEPVFRSTREELAGWVGASREAVTRTLLDLASDGVVALGRGEVRLLG